MEPDTVTVNLHHGGQFVGDYAYVGGKVDLFKEFEWVFTSHNMDVIARALGYSKVVKSGIRANGSNTFTFLPKDEYVLLDIIRSALDWEKRCFDLFIEGLYENEESFNQMHGLSLEEVVVGEGGDGRMAGKGKNVIDEAENCIFEDASEDDETDISDEYIMDDDSEYESEPECYVNSDFSDDDEEVLEARKILRLRNIRRERGLTDDDALNEHETSIINLSNKCKVYDKDCDHATLKFELGMRFRDKKECQDAVAMSAILNGYNIRWTRSSQQNLQAECRGNCPWKLYASKLTPEPTFVIKRLIDHYGCIKTKRNKQANKKWIANQIQSHMKRNPSMPAKEIQADMNERFDIIISRHMCYRAKPIALDNIRGCLQDEYKKLRSYVLELMRSDREGRFILRTEKTADDQHVFQRIFIGFSALRNGFLKGCRHIICFDACFLKTVTKGALLAAIGKDCNFKMYPIAWAVVEAENEETWTWFCKALFEHFGMGDCLGWSFMSDKQKGLINVIRKLAPNAEHRHCARHVYENWKKKWPGLKFSDLFWGCVKASTNVQYEKRLLDLKATSVEAWNDFCIRNPKSFCKSQVTSFKKTDCVDNNICESFNSFILQARDKPILQMLEDIRMNLMTRMHDIAKSLEKCKDEVCPNVRSNLYKIEKFSRYCNIKPAAAEWKYEVHIFNEAYIVDLESRSCGCRDWELTGLPCCHAIACIYHKRDIIAKYIDPFFLTRNAVEMYKSCLEPIRGEQDWPIDNMLPILPPIVKRQPGRPKKLRKRAHDEVRKSGPTKLSRHGIKMSCKNCGGIGHNKRSCKTLPRTTNSEGGPSNTRLCMPAKKKSTNTTKMDAVTTQIRECNNLRATQSKKFKQTAKQGYGLLHTDSGNVFVRPPEHAKSKFVSGPRATVEAIRRIGAQMRSQVPRDGLHVAVK